MLAVRIISDIKALPIDNFLGRFHGEAQKSSLVISGSRLKFRK
jgi:hypothetical protein